MAGVLDWCLSLRSSLPTAARFQARKKKKSRNPAEPLRSPRTSCSECSETVLHTQLRCLGVGWGQRQRGRINVFVHNLCVPQQCCSVPRPANNSQQAFCILSYFFCGLQDPPPELVSMYIRTCDRGGGVSPAKYSFNADHNIHPLGTNGLSATRSAPKEESKNTVVCRSHRLSINACKTNSRNTASRRASISPAISLTAAQLVRPPFKYETKVKRKDDDSEILTNRRVKQWSSARKNNRAVLDYTGLPILGSSQACTNRLPHDK